MTLELSETEALELHKICYITANAIEQGAATAKRDLTCLQSFQLDMLVNIAVQLEVQSKDFDKEELKRQVKNYKESFKKEQERLAKKN